MRFRLVLDTALSACTVGVFEYDQPLACFHQDMRTGQQEAIGGLVHQALSQANLTVFDLSCIGTTLGPGSFTGLRIGLSFAKGLSFGGVVRLLGLSTLDGLLWSLPRPSGVCVMDGGRNKLYIKHREGDAVSQTFVRLQDDYDGLEALGKAIGKTDYVTGPAAEALKAYFPEAEKFAQTSPTPQALNALLTSEHALTDLTPLYMREADASVSLKPKLVL